MTSIQAKSKFSQIWPSRPKLKPNFSKEKAWISLDFLVRNEPFQAVIVTPRAKKSFFAPLPAIGLPTMAGPIRRPIQAIILSDFRKQNLLDPQ
jgi:hypothetical protein